MMARDAPAIGLDETFRLITTELQQHNLDPILCDGLHFYQCARLQTRSLAVGLV
jgi:hypothetical protein